MSQPGKEDAIVEAALDLPPESRGIFLDKACGDDADLRQLVEALLKVHQHASGLRESTPSPPNQTIRVSVQPIEKEGDRIGRYKLLQQVGEGGCGVVYMAEQEEPVRRRVALKVIKLGMDTKQVIARFEAERQALALMDHPNIAKVLDAGATDAGRPYFVMELVRGIKVTDYCDQNNLATAQRLELFIQICHAIQHAHQKGIIHRDIKPSNILVTLHDGVPVPKVIDFGIAKATEQRLTDKTLFTALEQFMGTPAYMSPEQAEMRGLDIDTRSDIYSLGVLLYELLTGKTPFDAKDLMVAGMDEMRRIIREKDPIRPSTRLSSLDLAEQTTAARRRQVAAPKLIHLMRGDLDWIVMKALEKDRTRRYETANGFAADLQRHLQNEPVQACPPSNLYRFQKMVRRNKLAVAAMSAILLSLLSGLGASTWMYFKERQERQHAVAAEQRAQAGEKKAQTEASKSAQVAQFLEEMLKGVRPSKALGRDTTMLREILDQTALRIDQELTNQPDVAFDLRGTLSGVYQELGAYDEAIALEHKNLAFARANDPEGADTAGSLVRLGWLLRRKGDLPQAETTIREGVNLLSKLGNERDHAAALSSLSTVVMDEGKLAEAETLASEALAVIRKQDGDSSRDVASLMGNLAALASRQGKLPLAEARYREALAMQRKIQGDLNPSAAKMLFNLGTVLEHESKFAEAEKSEREALAMQRKLLGNEHPEVADSLRFLAYLFRDQGKLAEAEASLRESLSIFEKKLPGNWKTFRVRTLLGACLVDETNYAGAEPLLLSGYEGMKKLEASLPPEAKPGMKTGLQRLEQLYQATGRPEKAAAVKQKLAELDPPKPLTPPAKP